MFENDCVTCAAPWYSIRIDTNGNYKYCDFSKDSDQSDLLPSIWFNTGTKIVEARKSIQNGIALSGCQQCYSNEKNNFDSYRQRKNLQAAIYHGVYLQESVHQSPAADRMCQATLTNKTPAFIHVSLSNVCNLSCRTCMPELSSKLASTYKKINILPKDQPTLLDWTKDQNRWLDFLNNLVLNNSRLICLHFMGGEPLYHEKFYQLLDKCVEHDRTDFHITFVTNGTIWKPDLIKTLSKFKSVTVEVSLENLHQTNNYIRQGSDYRQIQSQIDFLLSNKTNNMTVVLRTVPQALSVEHYDTVIDFAIARQLHIDSNMLFNPPELTISVLPQLYKQQIKNKLISKYQTFLSQCNTQYNVEDVRNRHRWQNQIAYHIEKIIKMLSAPEPDNIELLQSKFIKYNCRLDQVADTDFQKNYPSLKELYEKYNKD
jgi:MoaA/NifB/PqqE/SkfB family radical SAM enzyme